MDCRAGRIYSAESEEAMTKVAEDFHSETGRQLVELSAEQAETLKPEPKVKRKNYMRNMPCPCQSGIKFKRCCWRKFS